MDKGHPLRTLIQGARALGVALEPSQAQALLTLKDELLRWNQKMNLTSVTDTMEVLDKHLLDSLALVPEVQSSGELLDLGSGAGFPGLPVKVLCPSAEVVLVDSSQKKTAFMKHVLVRLGLNEGTRVICARARGEPSAEGIPTSRLVVSRAVARLDEWLSLGRNYVARGGNLIAMLSAGGSVQRALLAQKMAYRVRPYRLPISGTDRLLAIFSP